MKKLIKDLCKKNEEEWPEFKENWCELHEIEIYIRGKHIYKAIKLLNLQQSY